MNNIKLTIEYIGTPYSGWQYQTEEKTIQGEIEKALFKFSGEQITIQGACLLYTSPSPRDATLSRMPSSA